MRTWSWRCAALVLAASAVAILRPDRVAADDEPQPATPAGGGGVSWEPSPALDATIELGLGGRSLYLKLFPNGWPTSKDFRRMALEHGEAAASDGAGSWICSGLGVPLAVSAIERQRFEEKQKTEPGGKVTTVDGALRERFEAFRTLSGLAGPVPSDFMPVFLPVHRADPTFARTYEEQKPWTWTWEPKGQDQTLTLDAIGLALYSSTLYAENQLAAEHVVTSGASPQNYIGRTDVDGFLGLVALECAVAALGEVRLKLNMDASGGPDAKPSLGPYPKSYDPQGPSPRSNYFPHAITPTINKATVTYEVAVGGESRKSRLFDQAALLLGTCQLAKAAAPGKTGTARFFSTDRKTGFFDPDTANQAVDLAVYLVECMSLLHRHTSGNYSSFAWREAYGESIRAEDAGIALLALTSFLQLKADRNDKLGAAQKHAAIVIDKIASFMLNVQKTSRPPNTAFCDVYILAGDGSASDFQKNGEERRSLAGQGFLVRGLLSAKVACDTQAWNAASLPKRHAALREAAMQVVRWLDEKRWDKDRRAYLDAPGKAGNKLRAFDAFPILGALRDMALDTGDVRYLLRYKAYLGTLRSGGLLLSETNRSRASLDVVKSAAESRRPPVVAAEVVVP